MIYDKLPIVLLSTMASERKDSTNNEIARFLLSHYEEVKNLGISELAKVCHVSNSSISRFCKEIGLEGFAELKELLTTTNFYFERQSLKNNSLQRLQENANLVKKSIEQVEKSVNMEAIISLCEDIRYYQNISSFGLLKAETVAMNFQSDMLMLGKQVYTSVSFQHQLDHILSANSDELIIIFSYTGSYFETNNFRGKKNQLRKPKIWMITGQKKDFPDYIDRIIYFESDHNQGSHPYQLQFIESLIAQEYAKGLEL
ncbi:MAG: MurR/RpiR family transcriptional regulator [Firmicutes bacterium]|nr:MurR/RpiR family transcriptional regulator [Bacillota bacterium]